MPSLPGADPHKIPIDPNGNLATKTEGTDNWGYEWNAEDRLTKVTRNGSELARFGYDPLGRRVEKIAGGLTTTYVLDSGNILRETRSDGVVFRYVHPRTLDEPLAREDGAGVVTYFHFDGLDSAVKLTDQSGQVVHTYQYDAWGNIETGPTRAGYSFTGREWDPEVGLYYYRARFYDPRAGRFLSEDPIRPRGSLYAYVRGNPVNRIDPMGLLDVACKNCSAGQAQQVQQGMKGICDLLMKPSCAGAVHRWGLLPCFQDMCFRNNPPEFACSTAPGPDKCGAQGGRNLVLLTPQAFDPRGCLDTNLQGTMAHEMSHICISGRKQGGPHDCDINNKTQFGTPYCPDQSIAITNRRTKDLEENCSGK